jgi:hypothetical protein
MAFSEKVLWVVNYNTIDQFIALADRAGANAVATRTDNNVELAINRFHARGVKVYGWRWPSANKDPAMKEAGKAAKLLKEAGMDGYFVDPEGEPGKPWDWNKPGLANLADDFCQTVRDGNPGKRFGVTSHYKARLVFPNLPWAAFFKNADVLLPQAYWRVGGGNVFKGDPAQNYRLSLKHWRDAGGSSDLIVPMAGEIGLTTATKIAEHTAAAAENGRTELHFYTALPNVPDTVWNAIRMA